MLKPLHALLIALAAAASPAASAITADELVARNLEAKGGAARLQAVRSIQRSGKLIVGGGQFELGYVDTRSRPESIRVDATLQGLTLVQAWDGEAGWKINPFQGRKDPERVPDEEVKGLIEDADIDGPIIDYRAKGSLLAYLGTEDIEGTLAHKLKVTHDTGDVQYVYLDPDYFLEIRVETQRQVRGVEQISVTDLGDYEAVGGVYWPMSIESGPKDSSDRQIIVFDKAEVNPPLDEAMFRFPAPAAR